MEQTLLDITKKVFIDAQNDNDFELHDYGLFSNLVDEIEKIESMKLKPHLIRWHMNMWQPYSEYIDTALEFLGYEYVGRMDIHDENDDYKFIYNDFTYDTLYRYKDKNCDYTNTLIID